MIAECIAFLIGYGSICICTYTLKYSHLLEDGNVNEY